MFPSSLKLLRTHYTIPRRIMMIFLPGFAKVGSEERESQGQLINPRQECGLPSRRPASEHHLIVRLHKGTIPTVSHHTMVSMRAASALLTTLECASSILGQRSRQMIF